jgi:hypothetical protein
VLFAYQTYLLQVGWTRDKGMKELLLTSLEEFFAAIGLQKAHWYRLFELDNSEANSSLINATFPSLACLMKMDHDLVQQMLLEAGLARKKIKKQSYIVYADHDAWESFIAKNHLDIEATYFTINNKRQLYIKVGLWCNIKHYPKTPGYIWKEAVKAGCYDVPKLRISSVTMKLANSIGKHLSHVIFPAAYIRLETKSISDKSTSASSLSSEDESKSNDSSLTHLLDRDEYPLFYHHRLPAQDETVRNRVAHELLKSCGGNSIFYSQISGHQGALIRIPSAGTPGQYSKLLKRKGNFMEQVILFMNNSSKKLRCNDTVGTNEAAACNIQYLFDNYEEEFRAVATKNNLALQDNKKMEPSKVEAMLHESGIGKSNSRVLFRHLNQFFGASMFASEKVGGSVFLVRSSNRRA